jgi:hypothetical protein
MENDCLLAKKTVRAELWNQDGSQIDCNSLDSPFRSFGRTGTPSFFVRSFVRVGQIILRDVPQKFESPACARRIPSLTTCAKKILGSVDGISINLPRGTRNLHR